MADPAAPPTEIDTLRAQLNERTTMWMQGAELVTKLRHEQKALAAALVELRQAIGGDSHASLVDAARAVVAERDALLGEVTKLREKLQHTEAKLDAFGDLA